MLASEYKCLLCNNFRVACTSEKPDQRLDIQLPPPLLISLSDVSNSLNHCCALARGGQDQISVQSEFPHCSPLTPAFLSQVRAPMRPATSHHPFYLPLLTSCSSHFSHYAPLPLWNVPFYLFATKYLHSSPPAHRKTFPALKAHVLLFSPKFPMAFSHSVPILNPFTYITHM